MSLAALASFLVVLLFGVAALVHSFMFPGSREVVLGERALGVVLVGTALLILGINLVAA